MRRNPLNARFFYKKYREIVGRVKDNFIEMAYAKIDKSGFGISFY